MHSVFRTTVSLLLLFITVAPITATADGVRLSLPEIMATSGKHVTVEVAVTGAAGVAAIDLALRFVPSVIRYSDIEAGSMVQGALIEANEIEPGRLLIALACSKPLAQKGVLFRIGLDTLGAQGSRTALTFEAANAYHLEQLINLPTSTSDGAVVILTAGLPTGY